MKTLSFGALGLGFVVAVTACSKDSPPAGTPTESPSASSAASATEPPLASAAPVVTASAAPVVTASATPVASASTAPVASAAPARDGGAMPKFDVACKADADCEIYMEGSAKDPCCPVCAHWKAATKASVGAFRAACNNAPACAVSCASLPMKAVCKAGACAAVPGK